MPNYLDNQFGVIGELRIHCIEQPGHSYPTALRQFQHSIVGQGTGTIKNPLEGVRSERVQSSKILGSPAICLAWFIARG